MKFVSGARLELRHEMGVEAAGVRGFGVDEQATTANVVRELCEPARSR